MLLRGALLLGLFFINHSTLAQETQIFSVNEDDSVSVSTIMYDGGVKSYSRSIEQPPQHGSLSGFRGSSITYYPSSNYNGSDQFTLKVKIVFEDNSEEEWTGVYAITVLPINDDPVAAPLFVSTIVNTPKTITLSGSDPVEHSPLTYYIRAFPNNGTLRDGVHDPIFDEVLQTITYTPDSGFVGKDTIVYEVSDGESFSGETKIIVTVTGSTAVAGWKSAGATKIGPFLASEIYDVRGRSRTGKGESVTITILGNERKILRRLK